MQYFSLKMVFSPFEGEASQRENRVFLPDSCCPVIFIRMDFEDYWSSTARSFVDSHSFCCHCHVDGFDIGVIHSALLR